MAEKRNLPKWATPDRQAHLLVLWVKFGNRCLLGHPVCPIPEHYFYQDGKITYSAKAQKIPCQDRNGNPKLDSEGKQLYLTLYTPKKTAVKSIGIARLYDYISEGLIKDWKASDREQRLSEWEAEQKLIHSLGEQKYPLRGQFNAISKEIWGYSQPLFYIQDLGMSGLTLKPFAKVRVSSSYMRLYIDLGDTLKGVSKAKRRKAIRYGKPLPKQVEERVIGLVREAVKDYLAH